MSTPFGNDVVAFCRVANVLFGLDHWTHGSMVPAKVQCNGWSYLFRSSYFLLLFNTSLHRVCVYIGSFSCANFSSLCVFGSSEIQMGWCF